MKNLKIILSITLTLFFFIALKAQEPVNFDGAKTAVFVEGLGNGITFTFNYDTRVKDRLGIRAGIGYIGNLSGDGGITAIPLMANYLLGSGGNYFDIGLGATVLTGDILDSYILMTFSFMYRKQPPGGGFMWKAGFAPFFAEGVFIPYFPGVSLGYSFQ